MGIEFHLRTHLVDGAPVVEIWSNGALVASLYGEDVSGHLATLRLVTHHLTRTTTEEADGWQVVRIVVTAVERH